MNETNKKWKRERENAKLTTRRGMRLRKALFPVLSAWILIDLFIMVFLPMRTTESPRRPLRILCSWVDPTLSAATIRIWLYSSNSWHSLESYAIFFSAFDGLCTIVTMEMKNDVLGFSKVKIKKPARKWAKSRAKTKLCARSRRTAKRRRLFNLWF